MSLVGRNVLAAALSIFPPCACRESVTAFAENLLLRLQSIWYFLREATKNDATFTQESPFSISNNYITYNASPL